MKFNLDCDVNNEHIIKYYIKLLRPFSKFIEKNKYIYQDTILNYLEESRFIRYRANLYPHTKFPDNIYHSNLHFFQVGFSIKIKNELEISFPNLSKGIVAFSDSADLYKFQFRNIDEGVMNTGNSLNLLNTNQRLYTKDYSIDTLKNLFEDFTIPLRDVNSRIFVSNVLKPIAELWNLNSLRNFDLTDIGKLIAILNCNITTPYKMPFELHIRNY